ncbi:MAG: hemolysin III family protein [Bacillota bacterium]|nr:hemolysin III family protein [Bacillota bacterium]MDW7684547.1 hemolysin III family protein [Bacillota bacterium]
MKEPVNALTHLAGFIAGTVGLVFLLYHSADDLDKFAVMGIYGLSILVLYGASSLYHGVKTTQKKELLLRKLDHIAIFLLIAGSYTPVFYYGLDGGWKLSMLIAVWTVAVLGILLKVFFIKIPRWLSTVIYLSMGWIAVIPFTQLTGGLPGGALGLILAGGIAYTIGAVIYGTKKITLVSNWLGFHEVFHLFILLGTVLHFFMVFFYIIPL